MGFISDRIKSYQTDRDTIGKLTADLPQTIMGKDNYNKAYGVVTGLYNQGKIKDARNYVKSQLQKIQKQSAGTQTANWAAETLNKNYKY